VTAAPDRPTLSEAGLRAATADLPWPAPQVVGSTGSTNADVLALAAAGAAEGLAIAADEQRTGRGRLGRAWASPKGASVSVSVLLRPTLSQEQVGWLPLLTGLAVAAGVQQAAGVIPRLKWPNDVLVDHGRPGKIAGVLLERVGGAAAVGFGINTAMALAELPVPQASSIVLAGSAAPDPDVLVGACLGQLYRRYSALVAAGGDAGRSGLAAEYRARCATIGRDVTVSLPQGAVLQGRAQDIDSAGRLILRGPEGLVTVAAGDVTHVR
jgi:BirA family biotin operon repressor/biotin-[acetyl-CoA-carboxylase] ligase